MKVFFGSKGGFLGLVGVRSVIGLPTGIIYSLKLYTLNSFLGFYFYVNQGGFFGSLRGLVGYWFTHLGFLLSEPSTFNSRLGFYFYVSQAWKGGVFWSLRGSVGYWFTHWDYLLSKLLL